MASKKKRPTRFDRRLVWANIGRARLWSKERGRDITPSAAYREAWRELSDGLFGWHGQERIDAERVGELCDELFEELAITLRDHAEKIPPDVVSAWEEAGVALARAKQLAKEPPSRRRDLA